MKYFRSNPIKLGEMAFVGPEHISDDIQILRVGTFFHEGQAIQVKKKDLKNMIKNHESNVRGIDLMLDFSHNSDGEAAAWFQTIYLSEDEKELWAKVDWTEGGANAVREKKYRYISADFNFAYKDNETLKEYGPTLLGAGLTNRPVVKKMNPTILSEDKKTTQYQEGEKMEDELKKKNAELEEENKNLKKKLEEKSKELSEDETAKREAKLQEREDAVKLSEEKIESDKVEAIKKGKFDTMLSEGKSVEAQREAFMNDDMEKFVENAAKPGDINLSETGHGKNGSESKSDNDSETPAQDEVMKLAEKKSKEDKIDLGDAISFVLSEDSKLADKYSKETEV